MILRVLATLRDRQLMLFQSSPALVGFMRSTARRILVRAANRVGKTKHAAAKLATLMLERAGGRFRAVAVNYQQSIAVVGQYLANFIPADQLAANCRFSLENGWTHQLIVLRNGTTCEIRSCEQAAISHAGSDLDGVWLDEVPPSFILQENLYRVKARDGWVWITATPIGRPVEYLRKVIADEDTTWVEHVAPLSAANCPWYSEAQVEAWITEARLFPDSYEQRINGAWEGTTSERTFSGFDSTCLINADHPLPKACRIGVGLDHGEHAGSQVAVLIAWNSDGVWALDEEVSTKATTPADDAKAVRRMLLRNGMDIHQVDVWIGDINSAGKAQAGFRVNDVLAYELAKDAGHHRQGFTIGTPVKGKGSVDYGEKLLNSAFLLHKLWVAPRCVAIIKGLKHSKGAKSDEDLKHALDALRYIAYAPLSAMTGQRNAATRYQLSL